MDVRRLGLSYIIGYGIVAALGIATKVFIEAATDVVYELHWSTTMPVIALAFGYIVYKRGSA